MGAFDKTPWIDGDICPIHRGEYEWEHPEKFFQGETVIQWSGERWMIVWRNKGLSGRVYMQECPSRWRGRLNPPVDVLLEI